jgi:neutral ceramidase
LLWAFLFKNMGKKIVKALLYLVASILVLAIALFAPINRNQLKDREYYQREMALLDTLILPASNPSELRAGWTKINITPKGQMPLAGYLPRDGFSSIHDSLYVRMMFLGNKETTAVLINADLLLFPPALKVALNKRIQANNIKVFTYLSATHTHNGVGAWDDSFGGQIAIGNFDYKWINSLADKIIEAIKNTELKPATLSYWESDADTLVRNRIAGSRGKKDGAVRGLVIQREDSSSATLFTYSAHATSISKHNPSISVDYPYAIIEKLEQQYNFGMYMAGMVGSHSFIWYPEVDYELIDVESRNLYATMDTLQLTSQTKTPSIASKHIPIAFGPSQLRLSKDWKLRNWVLKSALGGLEGELTYLRIGNTLMIGTPCDFSGEIALNEKLHEYAKAKGFNLIITSFNGNYVGYITHDGHYDSINRAEIREMNWVGPYYGQYFSEMIKKLIDKSTVDRPQSTETQ